MRTQTAGISRVLLLGALACSERASAQDSQLGDFRLEYGYTYLTPSGRSVERGGAGYTSKLPGLFKFWFNPNVDMFVRSDTWKSAADAGGRTRNVGNTFVGVDLLLKQEAGAVPELDFTYDVKLPTRSGFAAGEVDHEILLSVLKVAGRNSLEADLGDYMEGIAKAPYAHSFELTLSDEIGIGIIGDKTYHWTLTPEFDYIAASPDTPAEAYEVLTLKRKFKTLSIKAGLRITDTPYTGRFGVFAALVFDGHIWRHH